ncbi:MAG: hypothetical protein D9V44_10430 [Actinobacteria bacterium]|nr:MAG: hypothetical protein D9V44_10430 [Actinomycetota bacterium]
MGKANISFPDGVLEEIDRRAAAAGTTRSGFLQEAAAHYIAELDRATEQDERRVRIDRAIAGMREIGRRIPAGADGTALIRQLRDEPPRWTDTGEDRDDG